MFFVSKQDLAGSDREDAGNINVTTRKILRKKYVCRNKSV